MPKPDFIWELNRSRSFTDASLRWIVERPDEALRAISQAPTSRDLETIMECVRAGILTQQDLNNILPVAALPHQEARIPTLETLMEILEWREPKPVPSCWERIKAWAEHPDEDA